MSVESLQGQIRNLQMQINELFTRTEKINEQLDAQAKALVNHQASEFAHKW